MDRGRVKGQGQGSIRDTLAVGYRREVVAFRAAVDDQGWEVVEVEALGEVTDNRIVVGR